MPPILRLVLAAVAALSLMMATATAAPAAKKFPAKKANAKITAMAIDVAETMDRGYGGAHPDSLEVVGCVSGKKKKTCVFKLDGTNVNGDWRCVWAIEAKMVGKKGKLKVRMTQMEHQGADPGPAA